MTVSSSYRYTLPLFICTSWVVVVLPCRSNILGSKISLSCADIWEVGQEEILAYCSRHLGIFTAMRAYSCCDFKGKVCSRSLSTSRMCLGKYKQWLLHICCTICCVPYSRLHPWDWHFLAFDQGKHIPACIYVPHNPGDNAYASNCTLTKNSMQAELIRALDPQLLHSIASTVRCSVY